MILVLAPCATCNTLLALRACVASYRPVPTRASFNARGPGLCALLLLTATGPARGRGRHTAERTNDPNAAQRAREVNRPLSSPGSFSPAPTCPQLSYGTRQPTRNAATHVLARGGRGGQMPSNRASRASALQHLPPAAEARAGGRWRWMRAVNASFFAASRFKLQLGRRST
ncbi:hypothetical protein C8Q79DRAFT_511613 [Trametes meyenii]|nr:hypothetical protein C8Q79DRAFT_511613 [Trametes meyenii]